MAFPRSIPSSWIVRSIAPDGTKLDALAPFQFGVFDEDSHTALNSSSIQSRRKVYFAVGSPNQKQFNQGTKVERLFNQNNADVTFRTDPFPAKNVDIIRFQVPKRGEKPNVYYLGYNGIDVCESLKFECNKTYSFHVLAKGRPVRNIFGNEFREVIEVTTDCCDGCGQPSCASTEGCEKYIDQLVDNFNNSLWVGRFFHAEKVMKCGTDPVINKTTVNVYRLTLTDAGDEVALSKVQNAYSSLQVKVVSRKGVETTYEVVKVGGAPGNFTQGATVIPNCTTCPSGYTLTASGYSSIVEIDNANPSDALATVAAISGWSSATSASLIKFANGTAQYHVTSSSLLNNPAAGVDARVVMQLGVTASYCTKNSSTVTSWVSAGTKYFIQRELCLTVTPNDCDGETSAQTTAELQAIVNAPNSNLSNLVKDTDSTDCLLRYTVSQFNNAPLEDGCDTFAVAKFDDAPTFKGARWTVCPCEGWTVNGDGCPVPPVADENCCQCGIKFTGRPTTEILDRFPGYDINEYLEKEPIELHITVLRDDPDTRICSFETPTWLHSQRATFRQLRGDDVVKRIITDRFYNKEIWVNQIDKENQLFLKREGIKLGVDLDAYYYAVDVYFNNEINTNNNASHNQLREVVTLFVHEEDIVTMQNLKNALTGSFQGAKLENFV